MSHSNLLARFALALAATLLGVALVAGSARAGQSLLNVSYDPTRELYKAINPAFIADWKAKTGETVQIQTSHNGSGAQARAVIDGLKADVVTLGLAADIDAIAAKTGKIPADWQQRLPNNSTPNVVTPNPKTSGGARWNYLAAWGYGLAKFDNDETKTKAFVKAIYQNAPVLDTGARGATITFAQRGLGDVLIAWENEAFLALQEFGADNFDIVAPPRSILAEPPVAVVDGVVDAKGTRKLAQAYVEFLYTPAAQAIIAKNFYRPAHPEFAAKEDVARLPKIELFTVDKLFGGWAKAQKKHFADGGVFDEIQKQEPTQ
jgi:sulfate adenylyltransferase subunit 1/sulfate transport system substrate-binding protein